MIVSREPLDLSVTPGLDPGIQGFRHILDGRVKPGHDALELGCPRETASAELR